MIRLARVPARVGAAAVISGALTAGLLTEERLRGVSPERRDRYVRAWARGILAALRVDLRVDGVARSPSRPHLVVANHRSTLDVMILLHLFGGHLLARGDMEHWPIVGKMCEMAGTLFVDRSDAGSGATAVRQITERLRKGRTIGVFPEGTTHDDDVVRPFHAGAFLAIARVRGEVTPVGIAYHESIAHFGDEPIGTHFRRILESKRTRVAVAIGDPIIADGLPIQTVRDRAHEAVQNLVHRARASLG